MRPVRIGAMDVLLDRAPDGTIYARSPYPLGPYPSQLTERLEHWARCAPDRTFLAQRDTMGGWRQLTYADALGRVRRVGQALLDRGLSAERPLAILSGNSIEHALLGLAAMYVGVPYAPIAPEYSLLSRDHETLRYVLALVRPALVFAADGTTYERALGCLPQRGVHLVVGGRAPRWLSAQSFDALERTEPTEAVDAAHARVGPDTVAKFLFTAGSTGRPKGVVTTQRMLCSNQAMLRDVLAFVADEPPVLCDWLPWNHVFGGSHNFGLVLYNGGTLYIDEGRPTGSGMETTIRNLSDVATTAYFNVPRGFELLLPYLHADAPFRERFFSRVQVLFYAAAGLGQQFWDELQTLAVETCGERIPMITSFGATESAPFALCTGRTAARSGMVGLPARGLELKLAPVDGRFEVRLRGPSITPGYLTAAGVSRVAFDEEGYCRLRDTVRFADPSHPELGFTFDGRLDENFKLSTGTWVSTGPLRARLLAHLAPYAEDVVITGPDRHAVGALIVPHIESCRLLCPEGDVLSVRALLEHPAVRETFARLLAKCADGATGSSRRVARALLLADPPSIDAGEITSKRTVSQRVMLRTRAAFVDELYAGIGSSRVIHVGHVEPETPIAPVTAAPLVE